jgi:hypothetical protein
LTLALTAIGVACIFPTDGCGCTPVPAVAILFGRVETSEGAAVEQATVLAYIGQGGGECGRHEVPDDQGQTQSNGTYRLDISGPTEGESTCVLVRVRAPAGSLLLDAPDTAITVALRYAPPVDSARVDATLGAP